ncbi:putative RNA binding protein YcfA (HicA-like mRNA interferase family) [Rhodococcus sp. LBL1]|uniref:type II toxin-antitoxin system HicA family toxin n=1 Tax=Prescottella agglutinans TaxID=1644129 RepID=UPI0024763163|nr:type II toxin-antitoxin system HicA family toxin [Prescottella agglutinans]MDH6676895.1 putative RNA binding protein YcfA (HicA-like mRNA interferase family) [Rhodococcus sp. LBL1]MDH6682812.1 putative RNA binding protein YcfA (HicA-like mRNA interferase family) [Rhodococcus sp. LBL2]
MVKEQATRLVLKQLRAAGFSPARTVGSHTMWVSSDGEVQVSVPDGHRTISPGVYRKVLQAIEEVAK